MTTQLARCGQPTKSGDPCRSVLRPGQEICVAHANPGPRPRGRCPECGKEHALAGDGTMHRHSRYEGGGYQPCGEGAVPMSAEQCERWDEAERAELEAAYARWQAQRRRDDDAADREFAGIRNGFRAMDEDSFAACPWRSDRVALIAIAADGPAVFACRVAHKRALLRSEHTILVAWPGEWSQHVFLLTDQDKAAALKLVTP